MATYIGKRIVPVHCGKWDMSKAYEMLSIVLEETSGDSYIARRAVPSGTAITDTHYWMLHSLYSQQIKDMSDQLTAAEARIKADNDVTAAEIRQDNQQTRQHVDESAEALTQRVNSAETAMFQQKASFDSTAQQLNARMDEVLAAGTGDGATEVADARVDAEGNTFDSLGSHIRSVTERLKSALSDTAGCELIDSWSDLHYYINCSNETVDVSSPYTHTSINLRAVIVPAVAGEHFTVTACGGSSAAAYAFLDSTGTVLERMRGNTAAEAVVVTAPENTAYFISNDLEDENGVGPTYRGVWIKKAVDSIIEYSNAEKEERNLHNKWINYGYDKPASIPADVDKNLPFSIDRKQDLVTISGTGFDFRIKVSENVFYTKNNSTIDTFIPTVQLEEGHVYIFSVDLISGTVINADESEYICTPSMYKANTHASVGNRMRSSDKKTDILYYVGDGDLYSLVIIPASGVIYDNAVFAVRLQDVSQLPVPPIFKRLEYIESEGSSVLTLGFHANQDTRVVCEFEMPDVDDSENAKYVFGARQAVSDSAYAFGRYKGKWMHNYNDGYTSVGIADAARHVVDFNKNALYIDGIKISERNYDNFETTLNLSLFAINSTNRYSGASKIFWVKVYINDVLVSDCIPVVSNLTGKYGYYDKVNKKYVLNDYTTGSSDLTTLDTITGLSVREVNDIAELKDAVQAVAKSIEIKAYSVDEADRVAEKVRSVQTGTSLSFIAISDLHYLDGNTVIQGALSDMKNGIKLIASQVGIDFFASFGDVIYRLSTTTEDTYDIGRREAIAVTKIISDAFGNNPQIRMVGNHDPNGEGITGYFTPNEMNAFSGKFSNILTVNPDYPYGGYGYHDFEAQKTRVIVLNMSFYDSAPAQKSTQYNFGYAQGVWLSHVMDLTSKDSPEDWKIVIMAHIRADRNSTSTYNYLTRILYAYQEGISFTQSGYTIDFVGKNQAELVMYINGHEHAQCVRNIDYRDMQGSIVSTLELANLWVPNALPGRDYPSFDGVTYTKTTDTAQSTSFYVVTIDSDRKVVYAHHYGAGIDIILHYEPTTAGAFATELINPVWGSIDPGIATVENGTVTAVAPGNVMIYAKSESENCTEFWNYKSVT